MLPFERGGSLPDDQGDRRKRQAASVLSPPTAASSQQLPASDPQATNTPRVSGFDPVNSTEPPQALATLGSSRSRAGNNFADIFPAPSVSTLTRELEETSATPATAHQTMQGESSRTLQGPTEADTTRSMPLKTSGEVSRSSASARTPVDTSRKWLTPLPNSTPPRQTSGRSQATSETQDTPRYHGPSSSTASSEQDHAGEPDGTGLSRPSVNVSSSPRKDSTARTARSGPSSVNAGSPRPQRPPRSTETVRGREPASRLQDPGSAAALGKAVSSRYAVVPENIANSPTIGAARALQSLQFSSTLGSPLSRFSPSRSSSRLGGSSSDSPTHRAANAAPTPRQSSPQSAGTSKQHLAAPAKQNAALPQILQAKTASHSVSGPGSSRGGSSANPSAGRPVTLADIGLRGRTFRIRIEAELLISDKREAVRPKVDQFVQIFAENFNRVLGLNRSSMPDALRNSDFSGDFDRWYWKKTDVDRGEFSPCMLSNCSLLHINLS